MSLLVIYQLLYERYAEQHWWPAETTFEIMVGAILTQNTSWRNVELALINLRQEDALEARCILRLTDAQLGEMLRPAGFFNVKTRRLKNFCRWYVDNGAYVSLSRMATEELRHSLLLVNGVGPETADDILLYAFKRPVFVVDAYTRRIFSRLGVLDKKLTYTEIKGYFEENLSVTSSEEKGANPCSSLTQLYNEYHALIVAHAQEQCRSRPLCSTCCLAPRCAYSSRHN